MADAQIRGALAQLVHGRDLSRETMAAVLGEIMRGEAEPSQVGALLMGLARKGETADEIAGAAAAMRDAMTPVESDADALVDTCGTGGSGVPRRNVSTAVAFVLAACGVKVAKHGNRAATSRSGSADVLEALGVDVTAPPSVVARCIDEVGVGFLFAAALHPAMKHAMPVRRALGVRTLFNLLGPLTNPAGAERQLLGVFDPARCTVLAHALSALGSVRVMVVHGFRAGVRADEGGPWGIDDLSPEGESLVAHATGGNVERWVLTPEDAGVSRFALDEIAGGDPDENAAALRAVLRGAAGPYRDAVIYSGAAALLVAGDQRRDALPSLARQVAAVLDDGSASSVLDALVETSRRPPS